MRKHRSPSATQSKEGGYESIQSENNGIGQQASDPRDVGTFVYREDADANAEGRNRGQQPHLKERSSREEPEMARFREGSAGGTNERSDSGCQREAAGGGRFSHGALFKVRLKTANEPQRAMRGLGFLYQLQSDFSAPSGLVMSRPAVT